MEDNRCTRPFRIVYVVGEDNGGGDASERCYKRKGGQETGECAGDGFSRPNDQGGSSNTEIYPLGGLIALIPSRSKVWLP